MCAIRIIREVHTPPPFVEHALARAGGTNRFGEPNFRAVWGWSRLAWIGGRFEDRDAAGILIRESVELRYEPKYFPRDRWHIERWCAPEMYGSPDDWARTTLEVEGARSIAALGPYPSRGEYEHVFTLEGPPAYRGASNDSCNEPTGPRLGAAPVRGEFIQLTPTIVERLARMIETSRALTGAGHADAARRAAFSSNAAGNAAHYSGSGGINCFGSGASGASSAARRGREALYRREAARDRAYDSWADTVLSDAGPAFHGAPHVIVPVEIPDGVSRSSPR